jgi:hypothetical protein
MGKKGQASQYTVTSEALEGMLSDEETKMEILHHIFDEEGTMDRDVLLILCELCVLHTSMMKYIELIKESPVSKEEKYIINSQDLIVMNTIRTGCKDLESKLHGHNIYLAIN